MTFADCIKSIAGAAMGLANSIKGLRALEVRNWTSERSVILDLATDEIVVAAIEALGAERENVLSIDGRNSWIEGRVKVGGFWIRITGPHTPVRHIEPATVDASKVAAAVEQAKAVSL